LSQKLIPQMVELARKTKESLSGAPGFLSTSSDGDRVALVISNNIMQFEVAQDGQLNFVGSTPVTGEIVSIKARQNDAIAVIKEESGQLVIRSTAQTSDLLKLERVRDDNEDIVTENSRIAFSSDGNRMALVAPTIHGFLDAALYVIPQGLKADACLRAIESWQVQLPNELIDSMALNNDGTRLLLSMRNKHELKTVEFGPLGQKTIDWSVENSYTSTMAFSSDGSLVLDRVKRGEGKSFSECTEIIRLTDQ
jgi:hypothetical protein